MAVITKKNKGKRVKVGKVKGKAIALKLPDSVVDNTNTPKKVTVEFEDGTTIFGPPGTKIVDKIITIDSIHKEVNSNINAKFGSMVNVDVSEMYPKAYISENRSTFPDKHFSDWAAKLIAERRASKRVAVLPFNIGPLVSAVRFLNPDEVAFAPTRLILTNLLRQLLDIDELDPEMFYDIDDTFMENGIYDFIQEITDEISTTLHAEGLQISVTPQTLLVFGRPKVSNDSYSVIRVR